jgi:hypothetical protein
MIDNDTIIPQENPVQDSSLFAAQDAGPVSDSSPLPEAAAAPAQPQKQPETQEMRFKTLRTLKEKAERERDEALRLLQEREQLRRAPEPSQETDDFSIGNDELAEGKHLKKMYNEIKRLQSKVDQYQQNSSTGTAEARLRSMYPDIEKVVSKENMEVLAVQYPELFATIQANNDFYTKGAAAYTMVKKLGIHVEDTFGPDREFAAKNAAKPKPTAVVSPQQGESPLTQANGFASGLTDQLKSQLYKEMLESMRNH